MTKTPLDGLRRVILTIAALSAGNAAAAACEPFTATVPLEGRQFSFVDVGNVEGSANIIGGTGAYASASGTLGFAFKDGNGRFDIDVSCN